MVTSSTEPTTPNTNHWNCKTTNLLKGVTDRLVKTKNHILSILIAQTWFKAQRH